MLGSYLRLALIGDNSGLLVEVDSVLGSYLRLTLIEDNAGLLLEIGPYVVDNTCGGLLLMHSWALGRWPFSKGNARLLSEAVSYCGCPSPLWASDQLLEWMVCCSLC